MLLVALQVLQSFLPLDAVLLELLLLLEQIEEQLALQELLSFRSSLHF